jgi:hypothetical protein
MAEDESAPHAKPLKPFEKQFSLCFRRPKNVSRAIAVTISRAVENDDPVILGSQLNQAARLEILNHTAVAVEKDQRSARATLHVVDSDAIHFNEPPGRRIFAFCLFCKLPIKDCRSCQRAGYDACGDKRLGFDGRHRLLEY